MPAHNVYGTFIPELNFRKEDEDLWLQFKRDEHLLYERYVQLLRDRKEKHEVLY